MTPSARFSIPSLRTGQSHLWRQEFFSHSISSTADSSRYPSTGEPSTIIDPTLHNSAPLVLSPPITSKLGSTTTSTSVSATSSTSKIRMATPPNASSAPPISTMFTFSGGSTNPLSHSRDFPIPSTELPENEPAILGNGTFPKSSLPVPAPSFGNLDDREEISQDSTLEKIPTFRFGEYKESSPFTFRKMHNATPEPSLAKEHKRNNAVSAEIAEDSTIQQLTENLANADLNKTSVSMPSQPRVPDLASDSDIVHERTVYSRYDVKDERPPNELYFNENFQKALQDGKKIAGRIKDVLETCELAGDRESHVYEMIKTASELHCFDAPAVCTIGIVGDSGVGKSSLINSLLDEADLARTAGLGRACTSVVTEYRQRKQEHTAKYTVEVDCMTEDEIEEQLRELLWSYRQFHLCDLDNSNVTADEQKRLEEQSKLAWDTLQAAFGSKRILTENYLQDTSDGAEEKIKIQLKSWTEQLNWPVQLEGGGWLGTAESVEDCNMKTQHFLSGDLWPFVKTIRVYLSSQVLKSGAVLSDLPGFHDSNRARVKAAEAYMYSCDEIFVVAEIGRVNTNKNVESILQQNLGNNLRNGRPAQGISLVCTKSEDLDEEEMKKTFFKSKTSQANRVEDLEKEIDDADANPFEAGSLIRRDQAQDELNYLYMNARNEYISKMVRETHASRFPNRSLSIFCVSNKAYKKNRKRVGSHEIPMMGSGIPALRSHCHKIPARAQFRIANHFLEVNLKGLIQKVQLWLTGASNGSMPNDKMFEKLMETLKEDLQSDISNCFGYATEYREKAANDVISRPMSEKLGNWTAAAIDVSESWSVYHHTQIAGFCRNYGSWSSPKVAYREWNLDLIKLMVDDMSGWWDHLSENFEESIDEIESTVESKVDKLATGVKDFQGAALFAEAIHTKIQSIVYRCTDVKKDMDTKLEWIKHNATENHRGSYIYEEMLPAYRQCSMDSGSNVTARRLQCLRSAIGSRSRPVLFKAIRRRLMNALEILSQQINDDLRKHVEQILRQVGSDIEMLRGTESQMLAKNGDFLDTLNEVMADIEAQMTTIEDMREAVKVKAEENGFI